MSRGSMLPCGLGVAAVFYCFFGEVDVPLSQQRRVHRRPFDRA